MPLCFAIMPITTPTGVLERYGNDIAHFRKIADHLFRPAAEQAGFEFRAPTSTSAEVIQAEIIENLEKADMVLCDISTWNANVFFELGIRVALDRPVAMVRDSYTNDIPFDNSMINTHTYNASLQIDIVQDEVLRLAEFLHGAATQTQNALWKYFGITQRAQHTDPGNPEDARLELLLTEIKSIRQHLMAEPGLSGRSVSIAAATKNLELFQDRLAQFAAAAGLEAGDIRLDHDSISIELNRSLTESEKLHLKLIVQAAFGQVNEIQVFGDPANQKRFSRLTVDRT